MDNDKLHAALRGATLKKTGCDPEELDAEIAAARGKTEEPNPNS